MNIDRVHLPDLDALYNYVDSYQYKSVKNQPPCIGLSSNLKDGLSCIANTYVEAVLKAGGVPVLIPVLTDIEALATIVDRLDGILMSGGGDINPLFWNEDPIPQLSDGDTKRDQFDFMLLHLASERQIPILGICRGQQIVNIAFKGSLYQDIYTQHSQATLKHSQAMPREYGSHFIESIPDTRIGSLYSGKTIVNSFHHQAVKETARNFIASAYAQDGIIEAIESTVPFRQILCVQWHPEAMAAAGDENMLKLFNVFTTECSLYKEAKAIHDSILSIDSHTDTPMLFEEGVTISKKSDSGKVNIPKMQEGHLDASCIVAYIAQGKRDDASLIQATEKATRIIVETKRQVAQYNNIAEIAYTPADVIRIKKEGKKAFFIGIENGYAIGKDLHNLVRFKEMGTIYITLCHNGSNDLCDSAKGESEWNGLSPLGIQAIHEMNRLGIMIDISHASEKTFYDAIRESGYPIIASHSSSRKLCNHARNLTDEQLKAIAGKGGVVQVCLYNGFLKEDENATINDAIDHILHIKDVIGIDHIGIGSDFDGGGGIPGCDASNELINITKGLLTKGFTREDFEKLWGGNFLRVMNTVQSAYINA